MLLEYILKCTVTSPTWTFTHSKSSTSSISRRCISVNLHFVDFPWLFVLLLWDFCCLLTLQMPQSQLPCSLKAHLLLCHSGVPTARWSSVCLSECMLCWTRHRYSLQPAPLPASSPYPPPLHLLDFTLTI